jgi:8-oxo-dGTP diphosphatase
MFSAAKAIIRYNDYLFLQLRDNKNSIPYPNRWAFFGGRLLNNENPQTGLIREIKEELSFHLDKPQEFYQWYNPETDTNIIYFMVEMIKKENFLSVNEGQTGKWVKKNDLDIISIAPDIRAVKSLL